MEYTFKELDETINFYQKEVDKLKEKAYVLNTLIKAEQKKLKYWKEIKRSKQQKLF